MAAGLRLPGLDRRPMHADEAILADKFGSLLAGHACLYDPRDFHGPLLAYCTLIPARLAGQTTYTALTEVTLRLVPAAAGILLALSPLLFAPVVGRGAAAGAAAMAAVSPAMVYYSRYYIPETLLALCTAGLLLSLAATLRWPGWGPWAAAGTAAGLMLATKETAVLALASAGVAYAVAFRPRGVGWRVAGAFAAALFLTVSLLLAPPWRWAVLRQAASAYWSQGTEGRLHAHPWYYYFQLLAGVDTGFTEAFLLLLAAIGLVVALRSALPFARFLAWYALLLAGLYAVIPYKTPWCAVSMLAAFSLLAGMALPALAARWRGTVLLLAAAGVAHLGWQAWVAGARYASDPRNPWVYAHTGTGVFVIRDRVAAFARSAQQRQDVPVDVYSRENLWPLPWYLREYPNLRWWRAVPAAGRPAPIVLASPGMEADLAHLIYEGPPPGQREIYVEMFPPDIELRPRVEVRGWVVQSLWDRYEQGRNSR